MEAKRSSEISVHIRTTRSYIPEDGNIHDYCHENLKSYIMKDEFAKQFLEFLNIKSSL
jgi:hypothetical protein